MADCTNRTYL